MSCEQYTNQLDCETAGCYWYDGACHSEPKPVVCEDYTMQDSCETGHLE